LTGVAVLADDPASMPDRPSDKVGRRFSDDDEVTKIGRVEVLPPRAPKRDRPYFIVLAGSNLGRMFRIEGGEVVLGRASTASIRLEDDGISRNHARVCVRGEELWIEDMGSQNGTFINGERVTSHALKDGDKIQIGATTILKFTYHDDLDERFQQKMYDAALHDGLTRAFNKRHFLERLQVEVAYAARHKTPLTLIMIDIDHFKQVNDKFGHLAGDYVLATLAAIVEKQLRAEDLFARYGGEEFAVLCRGASLGNASVLAERLRTQVEQATFEYGGDAVPITISLGVAAFNDKVPDGATHLVAEADAGLYEAKRGGRNRVVARSR
jgi:diguanylate cyclase (GGDEF)-like protein